MQLRRLAINGFKTFAGKSEFEFKGGITAVVGPNGSGKSNLSDAIRWALGEQSARLLRGTSMSDVIFAGTSARKASGMAEVTVVIDNSDRSLSLDFDEVSVTRRVYRDGDSQFLMNGVECRLKDITELFAGTGLGKEAYAAIEQGKVDAIISSQPQDRRGIFDEASGIMRYKNRKRDAERKLIDVKERTGRASDILAELKQKEPILEKQAQDAQAYKDAVSEAKLLEFSLICLETAEAHKRLILLETELAAKIAERERFQAEITLLEASYESARLKSAELSISYETASQTAQAASKSAVKHEMRAMEFEANISRMQVLLTRANEDLSGQLGGWQEAQNGLEAVRARKSAIEANLAALEGSIHAQADQIGKLQGETALLDAKIDEFKAEHFAGVSKVASIKNSIGSTVQRQEALKARASRIRNTSEALLNEKARAGERISKLNSEIAAMKASIEKIEGGLFDNKSACGLLDVELGKAVAINSLTAKELARCETVLSALEAMQQDMEGYASSVKEILSEASKGKLDGIIRTVGDAISVPKGLEAAIESALGGQINDIICSTADAASASISHLKSKAYGRATFLPLDIIRPSKLSISERLFASEGFLGIASDMVSYEERLRPAFEYLLGQTAVFKSLDDAISSQRKGIRVRSVTAEGELVSSGGAITGGSRNELKGSVITRRRKIADLLEQKGKLAAESASSKESEKTARVTLNALEAESASLEKALTETERAQMACDLELSKSESSFRLFSDQIAAALGELEGINEELASSELEISEHRLALIVAQDSVVEHGDRNDSDRSEKFALTEKLTEATRQYTGMLVEKATIDSLFLSLISEESSILARISAQLGKASELKGAIQGLEDNIKAAKVEAEKEREVSSQFAFQQEACTRGTEKLKANKDSFDAEAISFEQSLKIKRRRLAQASEAESQRATERARVQGEYAILSSKLEKDHGISFEQTDEASFQDLDKAAASSRIDELKGRVETLGDINMAASEELTAMKDRILFMGGQIEDLDKARLSLSQVIKEAERTARKQFAEMFELIRQNFKGIFERLFTGGQADIVLTDDEEPLESGIEIICRPPGKKLSQLSLLSGGEKALAAIALIFSFLRARPAPFCILDEIDAALDDANVDRFRELVAEYASQSQMIIITHRRRTMEAAARVYGVTMEENGVSKAICVDTSEIVFQEGLVE